MTNCKFSGAECDSKRCTEDCELHAPKSLTLDDIVKALQALADGDHDNGVLQMLGKTAVLQAAAGMIESCMTKNEKYEKRLQQSPYGDDKIDELEEANENLRQRAESYETAITKATKMLTPAEDGSRAVESARLVLVDVMGGNDNG